MSSLGNSAFEKNYKSVHVEHEIVVSPFTYNLGNEKITKDKVEDILRLAVANKASDIIFQDDSNVAIKANGVTFLVTERALNATDMLLILTYIRDSDRALAERNQNKDNDWQFTVGKRSQRISFRVNSTNTATGTSITLRALPSMPPNFDDINLPLHLREKLLIKKGLVIICGETGSGKSTLIASVIRHVIENQQRNILTYESPIEFNYGNIKKKYSMIAQTEVPTQLKEFSEATRNSLRRAGDVVLIGESRDKQTFKELSVISETGSCVYTTVHTNSVYSALDRVASEFSEEERPSILSNMAQSIQVILHQTLIPCTKGGRIPIIEWVELDDNMREELAKTNPKDVQLKVKSFVNGVNGVLFINDLKEKYHLGLVSDEHYLEYKLLAEKKEKML